MTANSLLIAIQKESTLHLTLIPTLTETHPPETERENIILRYPAPTLGAAADEIISVDIAWDAMDFTYTGASQGTLDPVTQPGRRNRGRAVR